MNRLAYCGLVLTTTLAMWSVVASPAGAVDDKVLTNIYHEGVKAYFAGDYRTAHDTLTQAIEAGTKDPRPYYFRGLANVRLGRTSNAQADFTKGAELEGNDFDVFYNVSAALERIQGADRLAIETYRATGRKNALAAIEKIRFEQFRRFDPNAGAPGAAATSAQGAPPATDPSATPAASDPNNPFGAPASPMAPAADPNNPFGAPTIPAAPADPNNPFGAPPPAAPPATPGANPFGS